MADDKQETTPPTPPHPPAHTPAKSQQDTGAEPQQAEKSEKSEKAEKAEDSRPEARVVIHGPEDSPLNNGDFVGVDPVYQTEPNPVD